ncbi:MAG TPA: hypothetical protein VIO12_00100, partial [Thermoanaerobaculia bacterium]
MDLKKHLLEAATLIVAAIVCALVANAFASRERKVAIVPALVLPSGAPPPSAMYVPSGELPPPPVALPPPVAGEGAGAPLSFCGGVTLSSILAGAW